MILSLAELLENKAWHVRLKSVDVIGKLVDHGEWQLDNVAAQLTRITKSNFGKPSQAYFHCLLNDWRTRRRTFDRR